MAGILVDLWYTIFSYLPLKEAARVSISDSFLKCNWPRLSKALREVDFTGVPDKGVASILTRFEGTPFQFEALVFAVPTPTKSWPVLLRLVEKGQAFMGIRELHISVPDRGSDITEIVCLLAARPLTSLTLERVDYVDTWLDVMAEGFSELRKLSLINLNNPHGRMGHLSTSLVSMTNLESLVLRRPLQGGRYGKLYERMTQMRRLQHLELSYCFIEDENVIGTWTQLTSLQISCTGSSDYVFSTSVDAITDKLTKLRVLKFSKHSNYSPLSQMDKLTRLTGLELLDTRGFSFSPSTAFIASLANLRQICLTPREHGTDPADFSQFPNLKVDTSPFVAPDWVGQDL